MSKKEKTAGTKKATKPGKSKKPTEVVIVSSEAWPWVKTGGLADVAGALPRAMAQAGSKVRLFIPLYKSIDRKKFKIPAKGVKFSVPVSARIMEGSAYMIRPSKGLEVWFIEQEHYFGRDGVYLDHAGHDYPDNLERFAFFCRAVLETLLASGRPPDVIHCNDWQTGLIPAYLKTIYVGVPFFDKTGSLITIHNMGYQGRFHPSQWHLLGISWDHFHPGGLESYGHINLLKAGLIFADIITTVSPTYAKEIMEPDGGFGLDGLLRHRADRVHGVLNGIDMDEWNPATDKLIQSRFNHKEMKGKAECKAALCEELNLAPGDGPLLAVVSRLADGKGMELLAGCLKSILAKGGRFVLLGSGDKELERRFLKIASSSGARASVTIGYDERFSHRIQAGADILLVPSRYEPCGLTQMYALAYGTAPLVRATGGLNDTVRQFDLTTEEGNGFKYEEYSEAALLSKSLEAMEFYLAKREKWNKMVRMGMQEDNSWIHSAKMYHKLYRLAADLSD
ncbi:MAG: glycogen synthase GlgA [Nitrospinota bacterium]|nr:glycogen synthase GlgA [Nitrospinota bacterium]